MERVLKYLQLGALVAALLAPWVFFVGYSYDWGYFDTFEIEGHMFFKAPQEYFGRAYLVLFEVIYRALGSIPDGVVWVVFLAIAVTSIIVFAFLYWAHRKKLWARVYLRGTGFIERKRGLVTMRFLETVIARTYIVSAVPVLVLALGAALILFLAMPYLVSYRYGQQEAKKIINEWHSETCIAKNRMAGCTQLFEAGKAIAVGKIVAASDKLVAIFDGSSVRIYSVRNREIKTTLTK